MEMLATCTLRVVLLSQQVLSATAGAQSLLITQLQGGNEPWAWEGCQGFFVGNVEDDVCRVPAELCLEIRQYSRSLRRSNPSIKHS